jgi:hypothetical protein
MAEERTLGLARAHDVTAEEPSKQELQRRLDEARDSISHTVTEIKESVANQVQAVKETLDWREQFKKRPVIWSAGAAGVGFLVGYGLAAIVKGDEGYDSALDHYSDVSRSYAAQPILQASHTPSESVKQANGKHDEGPGFFEKLTSTPAYRKVKHEAGNLGDELVQQISNTAKQVVLPALMTSLRNFIGDYLPHAAKSETEVPNSSKSNYYPALERNQV